jgi:hypothetical protein
MHRTKTRTSTHPGRSLAALAVALSPALMAPAQEERHAGARQPELIVTRPVWSGHLDALEKDHDPLAFALAPHGRGFLYYQGAPWPRLLYRSLAEPDTEPLMVAPVVPLPFFPPRFSPSGDAVYFTVVEGAETLPAPGDRPVPPAFYVARVSFPSLEIERLHPAEGGREGFFSVLLDMHPSGDSVLVGAGSGLRGVDPRRDDVNLEVLEVPADGGTAVPLELRVNGLALVRYTRDGTAVEYTVGARGGAGARVLRYVRSSGRHERTQETQAQLWRHAGELDVQAFQLPHRGSFGRDPYRSFEVREPGATAGLLLRLAAPVAALAGCAPGAPDAPPPVPVTFQSGRVLLCGGFQDRRLLVVAEVEPRSRASTAPVAKRAPFALDPRFFGDEILAGHEPAAREILDKLRQSLRTTAAEKIAAIRAEFAFTGPASAGGGREVMQVLERADGPLLIERTYSPLPAEDAEGKAVEVAPISQILAFDGERCWMKTGDDRYLQIEEPAFAMELSATSPFRWLFDPAGLKDPHLRFSKPEALPAGKDGESRWKVPFFYPDGYSGELVVGEESATTLPVSWRTPLVLPGQKLRRDFGKLPQTKEATFEGWHLSKGWWIPRQLRFDGGLRSYTLEVRKIEFPEQLERRLFQMPEAK